MEGVRGDGGGLCKVKHNVLLEFPCVKHIGTWSGTALKSELQVQQYSFI